MAELNVLRIFYTSHRKIIIFKIVKKEVENAIFPILDKITQTAFSYILEPSDPLIASLPPYLTKTVTCLIVFVWSTCM